MPERDPTCVGRVRQVLGSRVTVALDAELAGVAPIYRGRLQPVGQVGTLVRIPQGVVDLIGQVSLVGIAEEAGPLADAQPVQVGERWLQVHLLGEVDGLGRFQRGVGTYPGLDDPVHFSTPELLATVFPAETSRHVPLGRLSANPDVRVCVDAATFVLRHATVVGSTGAGKTSTVAAILQAFLAGGWPGANVVVVDPHGEYASAVDGAGSVRSVLGNGAGGLRVPYWALPAREILRAFTGGPAGGAAANRFEELVAEARRQFVEDAQWLALDPAAVTADTPVPFDVHTVWHQLDRENRMTLERKGDPDTECLLDDGDPAALRPAEFRPYNPAGAAPHKASSYGAYARTPERLRLGLLDPRLAFLLEPAGDPEGPDPLEAVVLEWLGGDQPISVLDFSGVTTEVADLAIGVVANLLFEVALRCRDQGIGRPRPVLLVLEESHRYLGSGAASLTRGAVERIAREGRKYGVGLLLVTQRPSELPDTALALCGTLVALRLANSADQAHVHAALPEAVAGLADVLPSLRTGEAIASGESLALPARILVDPPDPWPDAADPTLAAWHAAPTAPDIAPALREWRGIPENPVPPDRGSS